MSGLAGECSDIGPAKFDLVTHLRGEPANEFRVGVTRATAQLMIEMANDEAAIIELRELMQQRDRIAPAGDADEIALIDGKILERLRLEADGVFEVLPHGMSQSSNLRPNKATQAGRSAIFHLTMNERSFISAA